MSRATPARGAPLKHQHNSKRGRARRKGPYPMLVVTAVVFVLGILAVVLTVSDESDGGREIAPARVTGTSLPTEGGQPDAAVGMKAPEAFGVDFKGGPVAIDNDGRAKALIFLAHWCPHCQREVPKVVSWLASAGGVEGVDIFAVSTFADVTKPNWPPSIWLRQEGWPTPVLVDDEASTVAEAFGLRGTPMWVFVRRDGTIAGRASGEVPIDRLQSAMRALL